MIPRIAMILVALLAAIPADAFQLTARKDVPVNRVDPNDPSAVLGDPVEPGCYVRWPSGCVRRPTKSSNWRHDTAVETNKNLTADACHGRSAWWNEYCSIGDAEVRFVENNLPSELYNLVDRDDPDAVLGQPVEPGCYVKMPSGCPNHPLKNNDWRHDMAAEEAGLEAELEVVCKMRPGRWNDFCGTSDARSMLVTAGPTLGSKSVSVQFKEPTDNDFMKAVEAAKEPDAEVARAGELRDVLQQHRFAVGNLGRLASQVAAAGKSEKAEEPDAEIGEGAMLASRAAAAGKSEKAEEPDTWTGERVMLASRASAPRKREKAEEPDAETGERVMLASRAAAPRKSEKAEEPDAETGKVAMLASRVAAAGKRKKAGSPEGAAKAPREGQFEDAVKFVDDFLEAAKPFFPGQIPGAVLAAKNVRGDAGAAARAKAIQSALVVSSDSGTSPAGPSSSSSSSSVPGPASNSTVNVVHPDDPDAILGDPVEAGCYVRLPDGCPRHPLKTNTSWRLDLGMEEDKPDEVKCDARMAHWRSWCETDNAQALFVPEPPKAKRSQKDAAAARLAAKARRTKRAPQELSRNQRDPVNRNHILGDPVEPGCYVRAPTGCPRRPANIKSTNWHEERTATDEAHCTWFKGQWAAYCGATDIESRFVDAAPRAGRKGASELQLHLLRSEARLADAAVPSEPGCYVRMPSGCTQAAEKTTLWRHDTWAEQQGVDERGCKRRAQVWNRYCGAEDAESAFVA